MTRAFLHSLRLVMKTAALVLLCVCESHHKDLMVGSEVNSTLTYMEMVNKRAEPANSWEDEVYFANKPERLIKAIIVLDRGETTENEIATITAGGVGHDFVNISLKSEPGFSLRYHLEIYS